jgi:hypothetical protein
MSHVLPLYDLQVRGSNGAGVTNPIIPFCGRRLQYVSAGKAELMGHLTVPRSPHSQLIQKKVDWRF